MNSTQCHQKCETRTCALETFQKFKHAPSRFRLQVFEALPAGVKRQVWEQDCAKLQNDAVPEVGAYKYETNTVMRALNMEELLPAVVGRAALAPPAAGVSEQRVGLDMWVELIA